MKQLPLTAESKGGRSTKSTAIQRQVHVERLMKMGYSLTKISSITINGKNLGAEHTISKDIDIIRSRWLDKDPEWFHRARLARIEAKERLLEQMTRMGDLILKIKDGQYDEVLKIIDKQIDHIPTKENVPKQLTYAESQLTTIISKLYEIDSDFDPEQYLDKRIQESIGNKIKERTPKIS